jgi:hypothetical protein
MPRSFEDHLQLWRNNTHPGSRYEGFLVEISNFNPVQYGQVTFDYGVGQYYLQMINHENGIWFRTQVTVPSQSMADILRRLISKATSIPEKNILGIAPEMAVPKTTLPASLIPTIVTGGKDF